MSASTEFPELILHVTWDEDLVQERYLKNDAYQTDEAAITRIVQAVLSYLDKRAGEGYTVIGAKQVELSISYVSAQTMAQINHETRGINKSTDVLSFPLDCSDVYENEICWNNDDPLCLGEIMIAPEVCHEQASGYQNTPSDEWTVLMVHSLLHLFGFDHLEPHEAKDMQEAEQTVLANLGLSHALTYEQDLMMGAKTAIKSDLHPYANKTRALSFICAFNGIKGTFIREQNIKIMFALGTVALILGIVLPLTTAELAIIAVLIGVVLCAELFNSALEATVDLVQPNYDELAKRAKDTSAGAVLILCIMSAVAGATIFISAVMRLIS